MPILNPAASAIMAVTVASYTGLLGTLLASWWGSNYAITLGDMRLLVGTLLSMIVGALIVTRLKKQWYAGAFLIPMAIYALINGNLAGLFLDGTIYFFFAIMACEPKTAPVAKSHQIIAGIILAVALIASFVWPIPSGYIFALLVANLVTAGLKHIPFFKKLLA